MLRFSFRIAGFLALAAAFAALVIDGTRSIEFMRLPVWIVLGALGLLFLLVGQRRAPAAIGYSSRP